MKPIALSFLLLSLVFVGCQKEPDAELPENSLPGETPDGTRLSRMVYQYSATDSSYTDFFYDAQGRWIGQRTVGGDALLTESSEIIVARADNGIITSYTVKEDDGSGQLNSIVYKVNYDAAAQRYVSKLTEFDVNGEVIIDSTVFQINNNRMVSQRYIYKERVSGVVAEIGKTDFTYNSTGNPVTIITSSSNPATGGAAVPVSETTLQFDNRVNPLNLGVEGLVMDQIFFASANNITRITFKDRTNPTTPADLVNITYNYHSSNKPKSAVIAADGNNTNLFFRYQ